MDGERHFKRGSLPSYAQSNIVPLYAAPQPAQADARVGLTDARIARLRAAVEGECGGLCVDYHHAKAILAYLDDDRA